MSDEKKEFDVKIRIRTPTLTAKLYRAAVGTVNEEYDGEYSVIPTLENQTLATADKLMKQDVTVEKIPHYEVSNNAGGTTFIIAEPIDN